jgi:cytosine/adenosine deaminase-related metal-dependent hydrolase
VRKLTADYIFPIFQPPVKNGIVIVDNNGLVLENVIDPDIIDYSISDVETHTGFICPGFINSHCHLELSYLKGKMSEHTGLDKFIIELEQIRKGIKEDEKTNAILNAEDEMIHNGIVAIGDISNNNSTFKIKNNSKLYYHTFIESFASNPLKAESVYEKALTLFKEIRRNENNNHASITPHAPYSLSKNLFQKIYDFAISTGNIISIHHQESEEENKFFLTNNGGIKEMHALFDVEQFDFCNTGLRPLASIADYIPKHNPLQLVHNTATTDTDIDFATANFKNLYWCFCPNANLYIEQKLPNVALFYNKKCKITIGTDSLASNNSLSILAEIITLWANVPYIPLHELLKWATLNGAEFLQISDRFGSIEKGKTPGIILLKNINFEKMQLTRNTKVLPLIR